MRKRWILRQYGAPFKELGETFGISPLTVKCMVNRGVETKEDIRRFLRGDRKDLEDPLHLKDMDRAISLLLSKKDTLIAIATDYDCDGIFSGMVLKTGFAKCGIRGKCYTPDRTTEGYGLNRRIVDDAIGDGCELLITCDNGIAAFQAVSYAKEKGLLVIVTDHHEVQEVLPQADAVVDPKRPDSDYAFRGLCGAGVAHRLIQELARRCGVDVDSCLDAISEFTAIATVADIMELQGENRILVREGLQRLKNTKNSGLRALLREQGLEGKEISTYHIGFIIGPCFNAAGRIADVQKSFALLEEREEGPAREKAAELKRINDERKSMTEQARSRAFQQLDPEHLSSVLVLKVEDCHESLAGLVAGKIKEAFYHPTIVFTSVGNGLLKGSGRSIPAYDMFGELMKCKDLMVAFGGHKMAAGMTIREEDFETLRTRLNQESPLKEEDFAEEIYIDAKAPLRTFSQPVLDDLEVMAPFGVANPKPLFAGSHYKIVSMRRVGKERQVLQAQIMDEYQTVMSTVSFLDPDRLEEYIVKEWNEDELERAYRGNPNAIDLGIAFHAEINEFHGERRVQLIWEDYQRFTK